MLSNILLLIFIVIMDLIWLQVPDLEISSLNMEPLSFTLLILIIMSMIKEYRVNLAFYSIIVRNRTDIELESVPCNTSTYNFADETQIQLK